MPVDISVDKQSDNSGFDMYSKAIKSYCAVSFGQKKKTTNLESRTYSRNHFYPDYKKVPDGFKYTDTSYPLNADGIDKKGKLGPKHDIENEQVTVIDREKDTHFQNLKSDFDSYLAANLSENKNFDWLSKTKRDKIIIKNGVDYLRENYFPKDADENLFMLEGTESFVGDVYSQKLNICRHNAFLLKMLVEDYDVNLGIQGGFAFAPNGQGAHVWNVYKNQKTKKYEPVDVTFKPDSCFYISYDGKPLYTENLSPVRRAELDILSMLKNENLKIGFDKNKELTTSKRSKSADWFMSLKLGDDKNLDIDSIDKKQKYSLADENLVKVGSDSGENDISEFHLYKPASLFHVNIEND